MSQDNVRIIDIAQKANVSVGTVDRVLHNRGRVSEEVKQKVLEIARELRYEPNLMARTLGARRLYRLAALVPNSELDPYWQESKWGIEKAEKELKQFGLRIDFHVYDQHQVGSFLEQVKAVTDSRPDGILIAPLFYRESLTAFEQWEKLSIPFVLFNTQIPDFQPLSYIGQDSYQSGFLAAKLLQYGLRAPATFLVAHIAEDFTNSAHLIKKEQGFRDFFEQRGLTGFKIIHADMSENALDKQLDALLSANPFIKGVFVTTSKAYVLAPHLLNNQSEIRLVGYDLLAENSRYLEQGVIDFLINQNPRGQGYWGIVCLADHLIFKRSVAPIKYLPLDIITQENLQYYIASE